MKRPILPPTLLLSLCILPYSLLSQNEPPVDPLSFSIPCPGDTTIFTLDPEACDDTFSLLKPTGPIVDDSGNAIETIVYWVVPQVQPPTERDSFQVSDPAPTIRLNVGRNQIFYEASDQEGNLASCSYLVQVNDASPPTLLCKSDTLFSATVSPGKIGIPIDVNELVNDGFFFFDNCGQLDTFFAMPDEVSCTLSGLDTLGVQVIGVDLGQNRDTCEVTFALTSIPPAPSATADTVCTGDSIGLFANPPPADPGVTYLYTWTGPDGFTSSEPNPLIMAASVNNAGSYMVEVSNDSLGCGLADSIEIHVSPLPSAPNLAGQQNACLGEELILLTDSVQSGNVEYRLYEGLPPNGNLFQVSRDSFFIVTGLDTGATSFYLTIFSNGCESPPSNLLPVEVGEVPDIQVNADSVLACPGDSFQLGTPVSGPGLTYEWTGPNNFFSSNPSPEPIIASDSTIGRYALVIRQNGCPSDSGFVMVDLSVRLTPPLLSSNSPTCEGDSIVLSSSVIGDQYFWVLPSGDTLINSENPLVIQPISTVDEGSYQVQVTFEGCLSDTSNSVEVQVNPKPGPPSKPVFDPVPPADGFCTGDSIRIQAAPAGLPGNVLYVWDTPLGKESTSIPSLGLDSVTSQNEGRYGVAYLVDGCISEFSSPDSFLVKEQPIASSSSNSPVCSGEAIELVGNPSSEMAKCSWLGPDTLVNDCRLTIPNASIEAHAGTYIFLVEENVCLSEPDTQEVIVLPTPEAPVAFNNGPVCSVSQGAEVTLFVDSLSASDDAIYIWFGPDSTEVGRTESFHFVFSDIASLSPGANDFFVIREVSGCASPSSNITQVIVEGPPVEEQAFAGVDQEICTGSLVQLEAFPPTSAMGRWRALSSASEIRIIAPERFQTPIDGLLPGRTYAFEWSLSSGVCTNFSSDTVSVSLIAGQLADAGPNSLVCPDSMSRLQAVAPVEGIGVWSQSQEQALQGVVILDPDLPGSEVMGLEKGQSYLFTWTIQSACGESSATTTLALYEDTPEAGVDMEICNDDQVATLDASPVGPGNQGLWSSPDPGIVFADISDPGTQVTNLRLGENQLLWSSIGGNCPDEATDSLILTYRKNPVAVPDILSVDFQGEVIILPLENDEFSGVPQFSLISNPEKGTIEQIDSLTLLYQVGFNVIGADEFQYELCVSGCSCAIASVTIQIGQELENPEADTCAIPSIISPNGDGVNDAFVVPCLRAEGNFPNNRVNIYNRWGDEVFNAAPYDNGADLSSLWHGTFNGSELPAGTYFYFIDFGNGAGTKSGWVYLTK